MRTRRVPVAVVLALLLAGCAGATPDGEPAETGVRSSRTADSRTPDSRTPDVAQPTAPGAVLIGFTESGGIDGRRNELLVRVDGRYTLTTRRGTRTGRLAPAAAERLRAALRAVRFDEIDASDLGRPAPRGADMLTYFVEYQGRNLILGEGWDIPGMGEVLAALPPRA
ncbi:hypothetical protein ACFQLX_17275 [Streptomyces polyrhachis]|uniref:Lipoprotein n=1 Tax=Streptomyces polyrhachis TaxID=1282885 RepID=A0ABW2GJM8_9ACTN